MTAATLRPGSVGKRKEGKARARKFEFDHRSAAKVTDFAFVDKPDQVQLVREVDNNGKKSKEVISAFDKERIPALVKWLNSLGRQEKMEG